MLDDLLILLIPGFRTPRRLEGRCPAAAPSHLKPQARQAAELGDPLVTVPISTSLKREDSKQYLTEDVCIQTTSLFLHLSPRPTPSPAWELAKLGKLEAETPLPAVGKAQRRRPWAFFLRVYLKQTWKREETMEPIQ